MTVLLLMRRCCCCDYVFVIVVRRVRISLLARLFLLAVCSADSVVVDQPAATNALDRVVVGLSDSRRSSARSYLRR